MGPMWQQDNAIRPERNAANNRLVFQQDQNLVMYSPSNAVLWTSQTTDSGAATVNLEADHSIVLRSANGAAVWSSHSALPGSAAHPILSFICASSRVRFMSDIYHPGTAIGRLFGQYPNEADPLTGGTMQLRLAHRVSGYFLCRVAPSSTARR